MMRLVRIYLDEVRRRPIWHLSMGLLGAITVLLVQHIC